MQYLFWVSTLIPGFALIQRAFPRDLQRGILATLAWSFILTLALATPLVFVAYALHLQVRTVAILYAGLVAAGVVESVRLWQSRRLRRVARITSWSLLALLGLMVVYTTHRFGGGTRYDNQMHAAKILLMREQGFSLTDPYSPQDIVFSPFPANTLHLLHVVGSWVTKTEPLEFWANSVWFFKLLAFGGLEFLAMAVFRFRWAAVLTMLGAFYVFGFNSETTLPNGMSAFILLPVLLAQVFELIETRRVSASVKIALSILAMGAVHFGFWIITVMCIAPPLAVWGLWQKVRGRSIKPAIYAAAAMGTAAPFFLIAAVQKNHVMEHMGSLWMGSVFTIPVTSRWRLHMLTFTWDELWMPMVGAMLLLLILVSRQGRARKIMWTAVFGMALLYMFNPIVFELLWRAIPYWILNRAEYIGKLTAFVALGGGLALLFRPMLRTVMSRALIAFMFLIGGRMIFSDQVREAYLRTEKDRAVLHRADDLREALEGVKGRSLFAADPETSLLLPAIHVSPVMAPQRGNTNPADDRLLERESACREFLDAATPLERRREIARQFGIGYALIRTDGGAAPASFEEMGPMVKESSWFKLYEIRKDLARF